MPQSYIAEVVLTHQEFPIATTLATVPEAEITEESIRPPTTSDVPAVLYRVTDVDFHEFESSLGKDQTVQNWRPVMDYGNSRTYRIQLGPATKFVTPTISELGIHVLQAESARKGWRFRIETPDRERLGKFWDYCREEGIQFELEKIYSTRTQPADTQVTFKSGLTERQREVARVATDMGYYEGDGASSEEVAAELGISPSTLSTHLRRINAQLYNDIFGDTSA